MKENQDLKELAQHLKENENKNDMWETIAPKEEMKGFLKEDRVAPEVGIKDSNTPSIKVNKEGGWEVFDEPKKEVKKKLRFKTVFEMAAYNDEVINKHFRPIFKHIASKLFSEVRQSLIQEAVLSGSHTPTDVFNELIKGALNGDALTARKTWRYLLLKSFDCLPYSLVELEGDLRLGTIRTLNNNIRKVDGLKEFPAGMLKGMPYHLSRAEILLLGSPFENLDRVVLELNSIIESDSFFIES